MAIQHQQHFSQITYIKLHHQMDWSKNSHQLGFIVGSQLINLLQNHAPQDQKAGGWPTLLKNMSSSVGIMIPNVRKNKTCYKPQHYIYIHMQTNSKITTIWISNYFWIDQKVLTMELQMALDICSTNQCPTLIRKGLITKSLWQYPWRNPNKCQKPLDKIPEKNGWSKKFHFRMVD
jgi:hypothetical protein